MLLESQVRSHKSRLLKGLIRIRQVMIGIKDLFANENFAPASRIQIREICDLNHNTS